MLQELEILSESDVLADLSLRDSQLKATLLLHLQEAGLHTSCEGFRNRAVQALCNHMPDWSAEKLVALEEWLHEQGSFDMHIESHTLRDTDGEEAELLLPRAADTDMWPMGTHVWVRDLMLCGQRLLAASKTGMKGSTDFQQRGAQFIRAALALCSTNPQLERFTSMIQSDDAEYRKNPNNHPYVFCGREKNLSSENPEGWWHIQDAWQMVAFHTLEALENGWMTQEELSPKHKKFLAAAVPFLAKVDYSTQESSGSWEELMALRSSDTAWNMMLIHTIGQMSQKGGYEFLQEGFMQHREHLSPDLKSMTLAEAADALVGAGAHALDTMLPFESPGYEDTDPRQRKADAALLYHLQLDIPAFLETRLQKPEGWSTDMEELLLAQIQSLHDPETGGLRRYENDSYQGPDFFTNHIARQLQQMYTGPQRDRIDIHHFAGRRAIVPEGPSASWTHFAAQLSSWAGKRFQETGDQKYADLQQTYFENMLRQVTGEGEPSIEQGPDGTMQNIRLRAALFPEAILTMLHEGQPIQFVTPHAPLNWATAEAIEAFAWMRRTLGMQQVQVTTAEEMLSTPAPALSIDTTAA